ncbi:MAG: glycosyltransferase family 2 protein, partial [Actinomycetota bacterium]|nr:glycosyltransferase family 2 protein [Actinomycetota bacterium]
LVRPFLEDSTTVAVGGIIRIVNGCRVEELSFRRYRRFSDLLRVLGLALIESFGYRQLTTFWRLRGLVSAMRGDTSWGEMERTGFKNVASRAQARVS